MSQRYAVVDIETTGGSARRDKITEIGIVITDGTKILDKYSSLVNPERSIPLSITRITGITTQMVQDAPKFYEIAKKVVEMTEDTIFVAHNVRFDYQFLQEEFKQLGYTFTKRKLCTVVLSRKAFPHLKSHSLGNLIKHFDIRVKDRHRALDDAIAAAEVLRMAMETFDTKKSIKSFISETIKQSRLPKNLNIEDVESLPDETGVYYFRDTDDNIIYIGKSINIKQRVKQHFGKETKKANRMFREVAFIDYQITGSELLSLLLESQEIKTHLPSINVAQKTVDYPYSIVYQYDENGYLNFDIHKKGELTPPDIHELGRFKSRASAKKHIEKMCNIYSLCKKLSGVEHKPNDACFEYGLGNCHGACLREESAESYNLRAEDALQRIENQWLGTILIIEYNRATGDQIVFSVVDGVYTGYSVFDNERSSEHLEDILHNPDNAVSYNPEHKTIIQNYLLAHPMTKVVENEQI